MKHTKIEFIVYGQDNISYMVTTEKQIAISAAKQIDGRVCKRCTTIEELEALDIDCTVWG